jgi:anti-sigma factor RsiW
MYESEPRSGEARSTIAAPYEPTERRVNNDPRERPQNPRRVSPWVIALGAILLVCAALTACTAAAAGALQGILHVNSPARETVTRQFSVGALPSVDINIDAAEVQITPGASGQVAVTLTKETHAITQSLAQQDLDAITLNTEQNGDQVTIRVDSPDGPGRFWAPQRSIRLNVSLPPTANVAVTGGAGDVGITSIAGRMDVQLGAGNLTMRGVSLSDTSNVQVSAGNVTMRDMTLSGSPSVRSSAGNIEIQGALAPETNLDLSASTGNVGLTLPSDTRAHVEATTSVGNANISGFPHAMDQSDSRNVISTDLNPNPDSTITAHVSVGNLSIRAGA